MARRHSQAELPEIVGTIYDSIVDPGLWPSTLETLCGLLDGCLATLAVVDTVTRQPRFSAAAGPPQLLEPLMREYGADVPFYDALPHMEIDVPFTVDSMYAVQGPNARDAWLQSRTAREWVTPNGLDDFFWLVLMRQPTRVGSLLVVTDKHRRPISEHDLDLIGRLSPHIRRAVTIGDLFETQKREAEIFRGIVESFVHPVLVVSRDMRILFANPQAERLLAENAMIGSGRGLLAFQFAPAHEAVTQAVELGARDELALGPGGISVPLARIAKPAVAHVMPLTRRGSAMRPSGQAAAAIFISAAGAAPMPAIEAFAALFGLTAAEKRVAGYVAAGMSRAEIAVTGGVSDGTIKSQLATIFDKTGTGDQRGLSMLIRELSPPLSPKG